MRLQDIPEDIEPRVGDIIEIEQDDVCFEVRIIGITADGYLCEQDNVQGAVLLEGVALDHNDVADIAGYITEERVRLDPKCWKGKKIGNPKTKMKGGVRVNNCVPEGQENNLKEFSQDGGGNAGDFILTLARAWYMNDIELLAHIAKTNKSVAQGMISGKVAVEKILARGIVGPDGKVRKYEIDFTPEFDGVVLYTDDYFEYSDYGPDGKMVDGRTGKPWGPYEFISFTDDQLGESVAESTEQSLQKKIQAKRDALGLAREQRRARGQHQQGQREIKLQAEIDKLSTQLTQMKKQDVAEAGPFSYGYKKPRKGSVAYWAEKKRKEQEKGKPPIEPKDQMVGVAKVTKGVAEGSDNNVYFEVDSENAYNHIMKKFRSVIDWDGDIMVAPQKYWGAIQELAYSAGGEAIEVGNEQGVSEAKSLKKRVRVVQGEHAGKTGWIREIKHGIHSTAPKRYYVDIDGGGQANNLPASALRLLKNQSDSQKGMAEGGHDDQFSLSGEMPATNKRIPQDSTAGQDKLQAMVARMKQRTIDSILDEKPEWERSDLKLMTAAELNQILRDIQSGKITEAEYQGRKVPLGKPMAGDVKKSKVYVRKPNGKVVKVNFGDKNMTIKKSNPKRRKSFRARHNCQNPGPRWKARYWSCRAW
jgi:hypothetical protein